MDAVAFARAIERLGEETKTPLALVLEARDALGTISMQIAHQEGPIPAARYRMTQLIGLGLAWGYRPASQQPDSPQEEQAQSH